MDSLVSVIMPAYNASLFIDEAIRSVLSQSYQNFELLIVNDGSTDSTEKHILTFKDNRIKYFYQQNRGVSAARNIGLREMKGEYFCFLDADDVFPKKSIEARLNTFLANPSLSFVDGRVEFMDESLSGTIRVYQPDFKGNPLMHLLRLSDKCFSCPSWMIKRDGQNDLMNENIHHGEDLLFFMTLARKGGLYGYTNETVLIYRQHLNSAMRNMEALEMGYWQIFDYIKDWQEFTPELKRTYRFKVKKFMMLDYLKQGNFGKALATFIK